MLEKPNRIGLTTLQTRGAREVLNSPFFGEPRNKAIERKATEIRMKNASFEILPISRLKGVNIYYENDLFELASLLLRLRDARAAEDTWAAHKGTILIRRPTLNGLARTFAQLVDACYPNHEKVFEILRKHQLSLGAALEWDTPSEENVWASSPKT